jgi:hypothetical protein
MPQPEQEQIFEQLVDPSAQEHDFWSIGLGLRDEAWIESLALPQVRDLGMRLGCEQGVAERFKRARIVGLASIFFLQIAPFEAELREFVRNQLALRRK